MYTACTTQFCSELTITKLNEPSKVSLTRIVYKDPVRTAQ